jgi:hypothetical protein
MTMVSPRFATAVLSIALIVFGYRASAAQSPTAACDLVTAAAVSAAVGETVHQVTTARSPKSLCAFQSFPADPHVTTAAFQPHSRGVTVALFDAATIGDPKVGSTVARVGCRTTLAACQKALRDRSPQELYAAQPHGSPACLVLPTCFVSSDGVVWAMHGGDVVAVHVIAGTASGIAPNPAMALAVLKSIRSKL